MIILIKVTFESGFVGLSGYLSILKEISHPFLIEQGVATPCSHKNMGMLFFKGYLILIV